MEGQAAGGFGMVRGKHTELNGRVPRPARDYTWPQLLAIAATAILSGGGALFACAIIATQGLA